MPSDPTAEQRAEWDAHFRTIERVAYRYANLARRRVRRVDIHDMKQTVVLLLWQLLPRFDASRSKFTTWFGSSIPRLVIDEMRRMDAVCEGGTRCGRSKKNRVYVNGMTLAKKMPDGQDQQIDSTLAESPRDYEQERVDFREMLAEAGLSNPRYLAAAEMKFVDGETWVSAFRAVGISNSVPYHVARCMAPLRRFIERQRRER